MSVVIVTFRGGGNSARSAASSGRTLQQPVTAKASPPPPDAETPPPAPPQLQDEASSWTIDSLLQEYNSPPPPPSAPEPPASAEKPEPQPQPQTRAPPAHSQNKRERVESCNTSRSSARAGATNANAKFADAIAVQSVPKDTVPKAPALAPAPAPAPSPSGPSRGTASLPTSATAAAAIPPAHSPPGGQPTCTKSAAAADSSMQAVYPFVRTTRSDYAQAAVVSKPASSASASASATSSPSSVQSADTKPSVSQSNASSSQPAASTSAALSKSSLASTQSQSKAGALPSSRTTISPPAVALDSNPSVVPPAAKPVADAPPSAPSRFKCASRPVQASAPPAPSNSLPSKARDTSTPPQEEQERQRDKPSKGDRLSVKREATEDSRTLATEPKPRARIPPAKTEVCAAPAEAARLEAPDLKPSASEKAASTDVAPGTSLSSVARTSRSKAVSESETVQALDCKSEQKQLKIKLILPAFGSRPSGASDSASETHSVTSSSAGTRSALQSNAAGHKLPRTSGAGAPKVHVNGQSADSNANPSRAPDASTMRKRKQSRSPLSGASQHSPPEPVKKCKALRDDRTFAVARPESLSLSDAHVSLAHADDAPAQCSYGPRTPEGPPPPSDSEVDDEADTASEKSPSATIEGETETSFRCPIQIPIHLLRRVPTEHSSRSASNKLVSSHQLVPRCELSAAAPAASAPPSRPRSPLNPLADTKPRADSLIGTINTCSSSSTSASTRSHCDCSPASKRQRLEIEPPTPSSSRASAPVSPASEVRHALRTPTQDDDYPEWSSVARGGGGGGRFVDPLLQPVPSPMDASGALSDAECSGVSAAPASRTERRTRVNELYKRAHSEKRHADAANDPCTKAHRYLSAVLDYTKAVALSDESCIGTPFTLRSSENTISLLRHVKRILLHAKQHMLHDGAPPGSDLNTRTRHERRKLYLVLQVMLYAASSSSSSSASPLLLHSFPRPRRTPLRYYRFSQQAYPPL